MAQQIDQAPTEETDLTAQVWQEWFASLGELLSLVHWGHGTPEGVIVAPRSHIYIRLYLPASAGTTILYVKESGTGKTGWVGK